ncbi:hypothetical protein SAMN02799624_05382 [Paenibacillus sp. UNC496MF]|uniref:hypothetical protein n=1 Tax=Paenibacillus sp. UNC496MF TaxID=1502753 RepID=UPI0008ED1DDC|nr:hypothetical protein [Paenibacillus sp. UNC496MF]SFJ65133.1 hypothetical protein SAMN02799624_05382 [Paenibacillus sp. UNC496MF]
MSENNKRIGPRKNYMVESQLNDQESNNKLLVLNQRTDGGITTIDLILEPNKFDQFGSEVRLTFEEYCEVINNLVETEEKEWHELRMKDQINITRDAIIEATMIKYAAEELKLNKDHYSGRDINYEKRYDGEGRFIGEAVIITFTMVSVLGMTVVR